MTQRSKYFDFIIVEKYFFFFFLIDKPVLHCFLNRSSLHESE